MGRKRTNAPLFPDTTVEEIAMWPLIGELNGVTIAVYFRILRASKEQGREVKIPNRDLLPGRVRANHSIRRALDELEHAGLLRVRHEVPRGQWRATRTIELRP